MPDNETPPSPPQTTQPPPSAAPDDRTREANQWAMFVHFSSLVGFVLPVVGFVVPIVLWQLKKDEFPSVDAHGKVVANWLLSALIYFLVCLVLVLVYIGRIGLLAIAATTIAFAVIGGIKANEGVVWEYPFSIRFLP